MGSNEAISQLKLWVTRTDPRLNYYHSFDFAGPFVGCAICMSWAVESFKPVKLLEAVVPFVHFEATGSLELIGSFALIGSF